MHTNEIKDLRGLIGKGLPNGATIISHEITRLIAAGENYGSLMLAVKVALKSSSGTTDTMHIVVKVLPPGDYIRTMFNTAVTFQNEIFFYTKIIPSLQNFAKEETNTNLFDCFPRALGARFNLHGQNDAIDDDGALVMENLKLLNFEGVERTVGFDLETSILIIKNLAKFNAVPLAMKLRKPEEFQKKIKIWLKQYKVFPLEKETVQAMIEANVKYVLADESIAKLAPKIEAALQSSKNGHFNGIRNDPVHANGPFNTIIHTDAWVNNFMVKFENGRPVDSKIVDFQVYEYGNPARDLVFFLFTSVQIEVLEKHVDELIKIYHDKFISILKMFKCDVGPFGMDKFLLEIKRAFKEVELNHILAMLMPILASHDQIKDLDEINEDDIVAKTEIPEIWKQRIRITAIKFCEWVD